MVPHQLCVVHKMRNVRVRIAAKDQKAFLADFKKIFWADSKEEAYKAIGVLQATWRSQAIPRQWNSPVPIRTASWASWANPRPSGKPCGPAT